MFGDSKKVHSPLFDALQFFAATLKFTDNFCIGSNSHQHPRPGGGGQLRKQGRKLYNY